VTKKDELLVFTSTHCVLFLEYFFILELQALAKPHLAGKVSFCLQKQKLLATASS